MWILWLFSVFVVLNGLVFLVYWFELDDWCIKRFEPTFKKWSDQYRAKRGLL